MAADFAKAKSTKVNDSAKRRKRTRSVKVGDCLAVKNSDKANSCKFWLAKVQKPAAQHHGAQKKVNRVTFVKKGYYIEIHVYKPKLVVGEFNFDWDRDPCGARAPAPGW